MASTLNRVGFTYAATGRLDEAAAAHGQALELARAVGDTREEATSLAGLARTEGERGNRDEALRRSEEAVRLVESARATLVSPELRSSYFASIRDYYETQVDLLMRMRAARHDAGLSAKAFEASEQARARGLLELLAEARVDIREGADPKLLQQERETRQQLNRKADLRIRLLSAKRSGEQLRVVDQEIATLTARLEDIQGRLRSSSPRYAALTQPQPLAAAEIQKLLDDSTVLLEYFLGEKRSYLWAVSPASITSFDLPPRASIEAQVRQIYAVATARSPRPAEDERARLKRAAAADAEYPQLATQLSRTLLGPAAHLLKGKRLLIVADGALQYLSFAALASPNAGKAPGFVPLVVDHEIAMLPSASVLRSLRESAAAKKAPVKTLAVIADPVFDREDSRVTQRAAAPTAPAQRSAVDLGPDISALRLSRLVFTRREAEAILALVQPEESLAAYDFKADLATATSSSLSQFRIVHFATHGLLDTDHPEMSGLVLSLVDEQGKPRSGFLKLSDIYSLNLPADLVVLSACQTALGREVSGEGLVGLTRGFLYAGASRVLASLWKVDDVSTAELMTQFYRGVLANHLAPPAALRAAQIALWKQRRWAAPFYWGGFVTQGDWK